MHLKPKFNLEIQYILNRQMYDKTFCETLCKQTVLWFSWRVDLPFCAAAAGDLVRRGTGLRMDYTITKKKKKKKSLTRVFQNLPESTRSTKLCHILKIHFPSDYTCASSVWRPKKCWCVVARANSPDRRYVYCISVLCRAVSLPGFSGSLQKAQYKENTLYVLVNCTTGIISFPCR